MSPKEEYITNLLTFVREKEFTVEGATQLIKQMMQEAFDEGRMGKHYGPHNFNAWLDQDEDE